MTTHTTLKEATLKGNEVIETPIGEITLIDSYFDGDASQRLFDDMVSAPPRRTSGVIRW